MNSSPNLPTHTRWLDLFASLLMLAAVLTAGSQLTATKWIENLALSQVLALFGVIAGLALGYSKFSPSRVTIFALLYGLFAVVWQLGLTLGSGVLWTERLVSLLGRLNAALIQLVQRQNVTIPLLFLSAVAILSWILSLHAGYSLSRHGNPWRSTLPMGAAMVMVENYGVRVRTWYLAVYVLLTLLLVARLFFLSHRNKWRRSRTPFPFHIWTDMMGATLLASCMLIVLVWNTPLLAEVFPIIEQSWNRISEPLDDAQESLRKAFASLESSIGLITIGVIREYYGDTHHLGRGNILSDDVILTIESPIPPPSATRYFWRARHYDYYMDGQWSSTRLETESLTPDHFDLTFPDFKGRWDTTIKFNTHIPLSTIFTPPQPTWVSRPVDIKLAKYPDSTVDVVAMHATPLLFNGDTYEVQASISNVTAGELRAAGVDYPAWITDRYLQLPSTITNRTINLAHKITSSLENPYDKAIAITEYLRANISYSEIVPQFPQDQDPIDWMLFDLQEGFCNYYASAEVIMSRVLGIPARFSVGYAQGELVSIPDLEPGPDGRFGLIPGEIGEVPSDRVTYIVRQRNAHAWPEAYFPGIGWVEFEPTANQDPLLRSVGEQILSAEGNSPVSGRDIGPSTGSDTGEEQELYEKKIKKFPGLVKSSSHRVTNPFSWILILVSGVFGALLILWLVLRFFGLPSFPMMIEASILRLDLKPPTYLRHWARRGSLHPIARAYNQINLSLKRLGVPPHHTSTPAERASSLIQMLPESTEPVKSLLSEYQSMIYSPRSGDLSIAKHASWRIRKLSYKAWLGQLFSKVRRNEK